MAHRTATLEAAQRLNDRMAGVQGVIKCVGEAAASNNASASRIREEISFAMELLYRECDAIINAINSTLIEPLESAEQ